MRRMVGEMVLQCWLCRRGYVVAAAETIMMGEYCNTSCLFPIQIGIFVYIESCNMTVLQLNQYGILHGVTSQDE